MAKRGAVALIVAFLLIAVITLADAHRPAPAASPLICKKAYGVKQHETCFAVAQATGLPLKQFLLFNPNINCDNLFIGQWVCLAAVPGAWSALAGTLIMSTRWLRFVLFVSPRKNVVVL